MKLKKELLCLLSVFQFSLVGIRNKIAEAKKRTGWTLYPYINWDVFAKNKHEPFSFINLENVSRPMYNSHQRDSNYSKLSS